MILSYTSLPLGVSTIPRTRLGPGVVWDRGQGGLLAERDGWSMLLWIIPFLPRHAYSHLLSFWPCCSPAQNILWEAAWQGKGFRAEKEQFTFPVTDLGCHFTFWTLVSLAIKKRADFIKLIGEVTDVSSLCSVSSFLPLSLMFPGGCAALSLGLVGCVRPHRGI